MKKCPICGSTEIDSGNLRGVGSLTPSFGGNVYFSEKAGLLSLGQKTKAFACLNCGFVGVFVDPFGRRRI